MVERNESGRGDIVVHVRRLFRVGFNSGCGWAGQGLFHSKQNGYAVQFLSVQFVLRTKNQTKNKLSKRGNTGVVVKSESQIEAV